MNEKEIALEESKSKLELNTKEIGTLVAAKAALETEIALSKKHLDNKVDEHKSAMNNLNGELTSKLAELSSITLLHQNTGKELSEYKNKHSQAEERISSLTSQLESSNDKHE